MLLPEGVTKIPGQQVRMRHNEHMGDKTASQNIANMSTATASTRAIDGISVDSDGTCRTRYGTFHECPHCGSQLQPEHAHFKCFTCGWRDSCCD